jgi:hypothetical protein
LASGKPDVDGLVEDLRKIYCAAGTLLMIDIGKLVLQRIYGGDIERWRSRNGRKDASFRKVAEHYRLPFSRATLCRAVGIHVLSLRCPNVLEMRSVGPCHLREIIGLDATVQDKLLAETVEQEWSVCRLHDEVRQLRKATASGATDLTRLTFADLLQTWRPDVEARGLLQDIDRVDRLEPAKAAELLETAKHLAQQTETLIRHLARRASGRPPSETEATVSPVPDRPSGIMPTVSTRRQSSHVAVRRSRR